MRKLVELLRIAHLLDAALVHDRDRVGHRHGLLLIVRHVQEGETDLALDVLELDLHLTAQLEVERTQGLVEQEERRAVHDGARESHALLLATRELRRLAVRDVIEFHELESLVRERIGILDTAALETERDVLDDRHVRKERVALEHRVDGPLVGPSARHIPTADEDAAGRWFL